MKNKNQLYLSFFTQNDMQRKKHLISLLDVLWNNAIAMWGEKSIFDRICHGIYINILNRFL